MSSSRRTWVAAAALVCLVGIGLACLVLRSDGTHAGGIFASRAVYLCYLLLIGGGFAGTGLHAWHRRPGNLVGPLMTVAGCVWLVRGLEVSGNGGLFAVGDIAAPLAFAVLTHLLLVFPSGRLESWQQRLLVVIAYVNVTVLQVVAFAFTDTRAPYAGCVDCPRNPILLTDSRTTVGWIGVVQGLCALVVLVVLVGLVVVLARRWRRATPGQRRSLTPVLVAGALTLGFLAVAVVGIAPKASDVALLVALTCFACVPFGFLLGLLRSRLGEAEAVALVVLRSSSPTGSPRSPPTSTPTATASTSPG